MRNNEQIVIFGGQHNGDGARIGSRLTAGHKVATVAVVGWLDGSRRLTGGSPKWWQH